MLPSLSLGGSVTLAAWVVGSLLVVAVVGSAAWAGWRLRRPVLPTWEGAPARLVESVLAVAIVIGTCQALGAIGRFERVAVASAVMVVSASVGALGRGRPRAVTPSVSPPPDPTGRLGIIAAVVAGAWVTGQWVTFMVASARHGIINDDSLWYHLPRAARFVQTGWLTRLHYTAPEFPDTFHPENGEVVQALPMLLYGRDALAPFLNLGWLALTLLAAWCIGRPFGRATLCFVGVAALLAAPLLVVAQPGAASNDLMAVSLLLASVAILVQPDRSLAAVAVAGLAAGLAVSTKLSVVPIVVVLVVGVVAVGEPGSRLKRSVAWLLPLVAFGSYWYVRNWVAVGSPVPATSLPFFPTSRFRVVDEFGFSVADYATNRQVWRDWFVPGLRYDFGWAWPAVLMSLGAASFGALASRGNRLLQGVGASLGISAIVYVTLPTTALGERGEPLLFAANVIYLVPALLLSVAVLPLLRPFHRSSPARLLLGIYLAVLFVGSTTSPFPAWAEGLGELGAGVAAALAVTGTLAVLRPPSEGMRRAAAVLAVVALSVTGVLASHRYVAHGGDERPFYRWADELVDARVAIAGFGQQYPFYGPRLDNVVQYVGEVGPHGEFHDIRTCTEWRQRLRAGRFDRIVLRPDRSDTGRQLAWTRTDPAATLLLEIGGGSVWAFDPRVSDPGCG